jgi:PleD family two-component response regulator
MASEQVEIWGFTIESALSHCGSLRQALSRRQAIRTPNPGVSGAAPAHLLIVDDDAMVREVLVGQMEEQGYCVSQASGGLEALARFRRLVTVTASETSNSRP